MYLAPAATHRLEEFWTNPEVFDPGRFEAPREEHKAHRFLFMPYGGGPHGCLGMVLADMQAKVFAWHLLTRFRVELSFPSALITWILSQCPCPRISFQFAFVPFESRPVFARRHGLVEMAEFATGLGRRHDGGGLKRKPEEYFKFCIGLCLRHLSRSRAKPLSALKPIPTSKDMSMPTGLRWLRCRSTKFCTRSSKRFMTE